MSASSMLQGLLGELAELHQSARDMLTDDDSRKAIIQDLGGDPKSAPQFPPSTLDSVSAYRDASEPGLEALLAALQDFRAFHAALTEFAEALSLDDPNATVEGTYALILDVLGFNLIRQRHPKLYFWMQVFSFAEDITSPFPGAAEKEWRPWGKQLPLPTTIDRLLSGIGELIDLFKDSGSGAETTRALTDSIVLTALTGLKISKLMSKIPGDNIIYGMDLVPGVASSDPPTPAADEVQQRMFTINFVDTNQKAIDEATESDSRQNNLVASLALVPEAQGGPGLFVSLGGGVERSWKLSDHWYLTGEVQGNGAVSSTVPTSPVISARRSHSKAASIPRATSRSISRSRPTPRSRLTCCGSKACSRRRKRSSGSRCSAQPRRSVPPRSTISSRRSCRRTGCAWTSTRESVSASNAASSSKGRFAPPARAARRNRRHRQRPACNRRRCLHCRLRLHRASGSPSRSASRSARSRSTTCSCASAPKMSTARRRT
jgi:hypothetical protein